MDLDNIKLQTTWNDAVSGINSNFAKIRQAILSLLSGGGGLDESQLEEYLSSNGYAKEVWVLAKKYLDAVALGEYSSDFITVANGKITLKVDEQGGLGATEQGLGIVDIPSHLLENITIEVDSELSDTSENAVQNKVITTELNKKTTLGEVKEYASDTYVSRASFGPTQERKFVTGAVEESSAEQLEGKELVFNLDVRINDDIANAEEDIIDDNGVSLNNGIPTSNGVREYVEGCLDDYAEARIIHFDWGSGLTDEQKAYNAETYQKIAAGENLIVLIRSTTGQYTMATKVGCDNGVATLEALERLDSNGGGLITAQVNEDGTSTIIDSIFSFPSYVIDTEMSDISDGLVQNKVIKAYVDNAVANVRSKAVIFDVASSGDPWNLNALQTETTVAKITEAITNNSPIYMRFGVALVAVAEAYLYRNGDISLYANVVDYESLIIRSIHTYAVDETTWAWEYFDTPIGGADIDLSTLATKEELAEAEEVTAAALNDLEDRKADKEYVEDALKNMDTSSLASKEELEALRNEVITNEEIVASSLNDLEERKASKEEVEDAITSAIASAITTTLNTEV